MVRIVARAVAVYDRDRRDCWCNAGEVLVFREMRRQVSVAVVVGWYGFISILETATATGTMEFSAAARAILVAWDGKVPHKAHRLSWEIANAQTCPKGCVMRHLCGTPSCVNPRHLSAGSQSQNAQDMVRHGRAHLARVTPEIVVQLRARHASGETVTHLAKEIGFTRQGMRSLLTGKTWKFVQSDAQGNML